MDAKKFDIKGMSCAACSARVEKAVSKVDGVKTCSVNLLTNSMAVEGDVSDETIIEAVVKAGYGASVKGETNAENKNSASAKEMEDKKDRKILLTRLISSIVILLFLMYISMWHTMFNAPIPKFFEENPVALALLQMLLAGIVMVINQKFFINGFKGIINLSPNMDTLVSMGSISAFLYSVVVVFVMISSPDPASYIHKLYFDSAAMVLTLITIGKLLEAMAKGKTTDALKSLVNLAPKTAVILKDGKEQTVLIGQVKTGDIFVVRSGDSIPVDGVVIKGDCSVNESALTGESIPVDKNIDDTVYSGTINKSGYVECRATHVGEDTALAQIIKVVSDVSSSKAPIAKIADKVSGVFVPTVISIALVTFVVWILVCHDFGFSLARAISVLVISCPCALGLATPVAIMVGSGVGARNGILFKTATALETTGKTKIVALDKTGTITKGEPSVTDVVPFNGFTEKQLIEYSAVLESNSEHPIAKAVMNYVNAEVEKDSSIVIEKPDEFKTCAGHGVEVSFRGETLYGGNLKFVSEYAEISKEVEEKYSALASQGKTPVMFVKSGVVIGVISVADTIKEDSTHAIADLKAMGIKVVMLTGDNKKTAELIGKKVGVDEVFAEILPQDKEKYVEKLQKEGKVIMVGDGINDAPALTRADVGIAIGNGTDIAIDSADVVVMKSSLADVVSAVKLSRAVIRNIHENLFWAFGYNIVGIPLAAGVFTSWLGWSMNPMFGAAAMSVSSFLVVTNALRLNFAKIKDRKDGVIEEKNMKTVIKIKGMMCGHCENRVKTVLEKESEVISADVSFKKGTAIVESAEPIDQAKFKNLIEANDYTVVSFDIKK